MPHALGKRLVLPPGYERPEHPTVLPWSHVTSRLTAAENYWLATTCRDERPHVTPVWGVWVHEALYFSGIPTALWARNLAWQPRAACHLESGTDVVIVDGVVEDIPAIEDSELCRAITEGWSRKYGRLVPDPANDGMYCLRPTTVRAWARFPYDLTRWDLEAPPTR